VRAAEMFAAGRRTAPSQRIRRLEIDVREIRSAEHFLHRPTGLHRRHLRLGQRVRADRGRRGQRRRWRRQERVTCDLHVARGDAQPLGQRGARDLLGLFGLNQLNARRRQLRLRARVIGTRPQLVLDERPDGFGEHFLPLHVCARGANRFLRHPQSEERIGRFDGDVQSRQRRAGTRAIGERPRQVYRRAPQSEVERLPRQQQAARAAPDRRGALIRHRPRNPRNNRAWQQQARHVVPGGPVDLHRGIQPWQVRRARQIDPGLLSRDTRHRRADGWVIVAGVPNGLLQRDRKRRTWRLCGREEGAAQHDTHQDQMLDNAAVTTAIPRDVTVHELRLRLRGFA